MTEQKKSKEESAVSQPLDEIPGWTSYIYSEHRFREPHEYKNYYKWDVEDGNLEAFIKDNNIKDVKDIDYRIRSLEAEIKDLEDKNEEMTSESRRLSLLISDYKSKYSALSYKSHKDQKERDRLRATNANLRAALRRFYQHVEDLGKHTGKCEVIQVALAGRKPYIEDDKLCTCNFKSIKYYMSELKA